jgi:hypothetical protein
MQFVTLMTMKSGFSRDEITARRMEYTYPEDVHVIAEYWLPSTDPAVVVIAEADDLALVFEALRPWYDYFVIDVVPAMTAERGMQYAKERMELAVA